MSDKRGGESGQGLEVEEEATILQKNTSRNYITFQSHIKVLFGGRGFENLSIISF